MLLKKNDAKFEEKFFNTSNQNSIDDDLNIFNNISKEDKNNH